MCEHCEPYVEDGEEFVTPLPTPEKHQDSAQVCIADRLLVACMLPPVVAGEINHCPMCGRDLRGVDDDRA